MSAKTIEIEASKQEIVFRVGKREERFKPVIFLGVDKQVLALGAPPAHGVVDAKIKLFDNRTSDDSFALLEAMLRFATAKVLGPTVVPAVVKIAIGPDIRKDLKGFAPAIFYYAAINSGAKKVVILGE